jgi:ESCRT-II complex subunit VPS36
MVAIAEQIKAKLARKELNIESEEMKEIQSVMFNMGITTDFSSQVSKNTTGKNYHSELAMEIEKFLTSVIEKFGGVIGLIDLYCMYNRWRGTDLISPEDLNLACAKLNQSS